MERVDARITTTDFLNPVAVGLVITAKTAFFCLAVKTCKLFYLTQAEIVAKN